MGKASRKKKTVRHDSGSRGVEERAAADVPKATAAPGAPARATPVMSIRSGRALVVCLALLVANLIVYAPVRQFAFVNSDDPVYVTANAQVLGGLSWANVGWAFTEAKVPYWHPLTFLSHMLDVELYGTNAGGHHTTSVLLHIACAVMLFGLLLQMTGALWRSAAVAALFSLHPLRVESVAWIAERKDVLSTFFWIATTWAYVHYVRRPGVKRYAAVVLLFALGLMAKPMIITLPFALLLLDYWPLNRVRMSASSSKRGSMPPVALVKEKAPLFVLALLASLVTFAAQREVGAVNTLEAIPFSLRIANALHSYIAYLGDLIWPARLAALYPYPSAISITTLLAAILVLAAATALAFAWRRRFPYLIVGWLWYLGTLLPVIGLIQVGPQARADRFTYVPHVGLLILLVWGMYELLRRVPSPRVVLAPVAAVVVAACTLLSMRQVGIWRDSETLWEHTLRVTRDNGVAHYNLGVHLASNGRNDEAIQQLTEAVRLEADFAFAHNRLALALDRRGHSPEVTQHLAEVVRLMPTSAEAYSNLGVSLAQDGRNADAIEAFSQAVLLNPADATARGRLEYLRKGGSVPSGQPKTPPKDSGG
jgi:tetratricopeptide (TPR) repeat protein